MAYEPKEWVCGETITAEGLNNLEEGVQEALECCGGGSGDYECTETSTVLTNENVEVQSSQYGNVGTLSYSTFIDADFLTITFNGTDYDVSKIDIGGGFAYGGFVQGTPDFSEYPFAILSYDGSGNTLLTETAGIHSVVIVKEEAVVTSISPCFAKAVEMLIPQAESDIYVAQFTKNGSTISADSSYDELLDAVNNRKHILAEMSISGRAEVESLGWLTGIEEEYGIRNFKFGFFWTSENTIQYIHVLFKYDNTVTSEIKTPVWA